MRGRKIKKYPSIIDIQRESSEDSFKDDENTVKPQIQIGNFSLTQNQYLMIMSKLPKNFSLQPIKNLYKSRKILSEISEKPLKKGEKEQKKEQR